MIDYTTLNDLVEKHKKYQEEAKALLITEVKRIFKDLLEEYKEIESLQWKQYAPVFNDGDPCIFSIHDIGVRFFYDDDGNIGGENINEEAGDYEDGYEFGWNVPEKETNERIKAIFECTNLINEAFYQFSDLIEKEFGSCNCITVNREGLRSDDFEPPY